MGRTCKFLILRVEENKVTNGLWRFSLYVLHIYMIFFFFIFSSIWPTLIRPSSHYYFTPSIILICCSVFLLESLNSTYTCSLIKPICRAGGFFFRNPPSLMSKAVICKLSLSHTRFKAHFPSCAYCLCIPQLATQYVTSVQLCYHCTSGRPICGQPEHFDRSLETATSAVQRLLDSHRLSEVIAQEPEI